MAESLKVLAQNYPAATTLTDIYTVPALKSATVSSLMICNNNVASRQFRISIAKAAEADTNKQYIYYDQDVDGKTTFVATVGLTLGAGDIIRVYTSALGLSFNVFGVEIG